jgi:hypothetical protein
MEHIKSNHKKFIKQHIYGALPLMLLKRRKDVWSMEEELENDAVRPRFYSTQIANTLPRKLSKDFEPSKQEDK